MRALLAMVLLLTGCGPRLVRDPSPRMTTGEMLQRATLVFIGTVEKHVFDAPARFLWRVPVLGPRLMPEWMLLHMQVHVEMILRGRRGAIRA